MTASAQRSNTSRTRRTLALDPGSIVTGWGLVVLEANGQAHGRARGRAKPVVDGCGVLQAPKSMSRALRYARLAAQLRELITRFTPTEMCIEEAFFSKNARSALTLGEVRGVLMLVAVEAGLPVYEYATRLVKQRIAGRGGAGKREVAEAVRLMLDLDTSSLKLDTTDALAVALCHQAETQDRTQSSMIVAAAQASRRRKRARPVKLPPHLRARIKQG